MMRRSSAGFKRVVVALSSNDETIDGQPTEKSVKMEEEEVIDVSSDEEDDQPAEEMSTEQLSSREILELQQKLAKSEKDREMAIRIAGEHLGRVEFLEGLIDKKPNALDGAKAKQLAEEQQKKIDDLTNERDELVRKLAEADRNATRMSEEQQKKFDELTNERYELERKLAEADRNETRMSEEQQKKFNEVTNERDELKRKLAESDRNETRLSEDQQKKFDDLTNERDELVRKMADAEGNETRLSEEQQNKFDELTNERDELKRKMAEAEDRDEKKVKKIDELTRKVAEYEDGRSVNKNIFELLSADAPDSIPMESARTWLYGPWLFIFRSLARSAIAKRSEYALRNEKLNCAVCKKTFKKDAILHHFLSKDHGDKVRARQAAVSLVAFEYWKHKLESILKPNADAAPSEASSNEDEEVWE